MDHCSFIGTEPDEVVRVGDGHDVSGDPLIVLEERLKRVKLLEANGFQVVLVILVPIQNI